MSLRTRVTTTTAWREASTSAHAIAAALAAARSAPRRDVDATVRGRRIVVTGAGIVVLRRSDGKLRRCAASPRLPAVAAPLSDVLLRPADVFAAGSVADQPVIVVSRSGTTTEAVDAVRMARERGGYALAVTCRPDSLDDGHRERWGPSRKRTRRRIVATSFAPVTLLMRPGRGQPSSRPESAFEELPARWTETAPHVDRAFELAAGRPSRVVVPGGGAAHGPGARGRAEADRDEPNAASAFHPLEFRTRPDLGASRAFSSSVPGGSTEEVERRVLEESAALGASTWSLGSEGPAADLGEFARLPLVLHALQALALGIAVRRGLDPDQPRHLGKVVVLPV